MTGSSPAMTKGESQPPWLLADPGLQPRLHDPVPRELVGTLVLGMAGVALDPVLADLVLLQGGVEALP